MSISEHPREPLHLPDEIRLEIRVVEEGDRCRDRAAAQNVSTWWRTARRLEVDLLGRQVVVDPARGSASCTSSGRFTSDDRHRSSSASALPTAASRAPPHDVHVHVRPVVVHRQEHVAWISADAEVGHAVVEGETVEGCVRLDETTMLLRVERSRPRCRACGVCWSSQGEISAERSVEVRILEDQQRAQHLRPRRTALRRRADDDVAVTKLEPVPPRAVEHERAVVHPIRHRTSDCACGRAHYPSRRIARLEITDALKAESRLRGRVPHHRDR